MWDTMVVGRAADESGCGLKVTVKQCVRSASSIGCNSRHSMCGHKGLRRGERCCHGYQKEHAVEWRDCTHKISQQLGLDELAEWRHKG